MDHSEVKHLPKTDYTPAELDDDSRILLKAAAIMERVGFTKGRLESAGGQVCLIGSILKAITGSTHNWLGRENPHPHRDRVISLAAKVHPHKAEWNDAPERTADEVIGRMRSVALGL